MALKNKRVSSKDNKQVLTQVIRKVVYIILCCKQRHFTR
mgnify:CR=1 FL=1